MMLVVLLHPFAAPYASINAWAADQTRAELLLLLLLRTSTVLQACDENYGAADRLMECRTCVCATCEACLARLLVMQSKLRSIVRKI